MPLGIVLTFVATGDFSDLGSDLLIYRIINVVRFILYISCSFLIFNSKIAKITSYFKTNFWVLWNRHLYTLYENTATHFSSFHWEEFHHIHMFHKLSYIDDTLLWVLSHKTPMLDSFLKDQAQKSSKQLRYSITWVNGYSFRLLSSIKVAGDKGFCAKDHVLVIIKGWDIH